MATLNTVYAAPKASGFAKLATNLFAQFAAWNDNRATQNELSKLSDHELNDIGLCRGDIDALTSRR